MKSWVTGSVGAATSALDAMQIHMLSERCLVTQGANNFHVNEISTIILKNRGFGLGPFIFINLYYIILCQKQKNTKGCRTFNRKRLRRS